MYKKILLQLGKILLNFAMSLLFNAVDENKDGHISKDEAYNFVVDVLNKVYKKRK